MPVTLRDVATKAGVDISTVSRVLRGDIRLSVRPDTRERILRVVEELNYRPNALARGLKNRFTNTLGMLIPDITNPIFPAIYKGVEDVARELGYSVILANTAPSEHDEPNMDLLKERRVDGFILATAMTTDEWIARMKREGYPIVLVNRRMAGMQECFVAPDDALGAQMAVTHLISLGHKRIGHISGPLYTETGLSRFTSYRRCLNDHGLLFEAEWVQESDFFEEGGYRSIERLLNSSNPPTAVFCANDLIAIGAMQRAAELGCRVPHDISIVGFNDLRWTDRIQPSLTTIRVPLYEMGSVAARMLVQVINGQPPDPPYWVAKPELVVRASTTSPTI